MTPPSVKVFLPSVSTSMVCPLLRISPVVCPYSMENLCGSRGYGDLKSTGDWIYLFPHVDQ